MNDERPDIRIADADRDRVIGYLRTAVGEGRISLDEFSDRAGEVYAARTQRDLQLVLTDLPAVLEAPRPDAATVPVPAPATTRGAHLDRPPPRRLTAVMNSLRRRGRWRLGAQTSAVAFWGSIDLDLRGALLEAETIVIDAWAVMGSVDVVLPEGVPVELSGMVVMGGTSNRVKDVPVIPGAPLIHVRAHGLWGSVMVRSKPLEGDRRERRRARRARHETRPGGVPIPPMPHIPPIPVPKMPAPWMPTHGRGWADDDEDDDEVDELVDNLRDDPSELRATAAPDGTVTILFSDIEGSTELADRLGDHRWVDVLRAHNELVRTQIAKHGGREVKVQGDGFMVAFSSAARALRCAMAIQRSLAAWRSATSEVPLHVRIGVHTGEVISEGDDFLGKHVMVAARIVGLANGDQILTSSIVRELTDGGDVPFDEGRDVELRGFPRSWRLYSVDWTVTSS